MVSFKGSGGIGSGPELPAGAALHPKKKLQVIRDRRTGYYMGFHDRGRTYVVAFESPLHVKRVCEVLSAASRMSLRNHVPQNVSRDIAQRMRARGIGGPPEGDADQAPAVDPSAHFYLEKRLTSGRGGAQRRGDPAGLLEKAGAALAAAAAGGSAAAKAAATWSVTDVALQELMRLPTHKNLGLVLPTEILADDRARIIFQSHVLDPCMDPVLFKPTPIR